MAASARQASGKVDQLAPVFMRQCRIARFFCQAVAGQPTGRGTRRNIGGVTGAVR